MTATKEEVAQRLATAHYAAGDGVKEIYRLVASDAEEVNDTEPVKLLEVNENTVPVGIEPLYFGTHPASGIYYPSVIVEITPSEFTDKLKEELVRRYGWKLDRPYQRPAKVRKSRQ